MPASSTFTSVQCPPPAGVVANCLPGQPYVSTATKVLPVGAAVAKALGAEPLTPETSVNYSVGLTAQPLARLSLTVDSYQIDIKDRIVDTGAIKGPVVGAILAANGLQSDLSVSCYTNAVDTRTRGVDAVAEYTLNLEDWGDLRLSAAWSRGPFDLSFRETRYGEWTEAGAQPVSDRTFSAKWIADLDLSYDVDSKTTLGIGANNLFDVHPDKIGLLSPDTGTGQFGSLSPFGVTGGYDYGRVTRRF